MDAKNVVQNLMEHLLKEATVLDTETTDVSRGSGIHEIATVNLEKGMPVSAREYLLEPNVTEVRDMYDQDVSKLRHRPGEVAETFGLDSWKEAIEHTKGAGYTESDDFLKSWLGKRKDDYLHLGLSGKSKKHIDEVNKKRKRALKEALPIVDIDLHRSGDPLVRVEDLAKSTSSFFEGLQGRVIWGANVGFDCLVADTLVQCADGSIIELQEWNGQKLLGCEPEDGPYRSACIVEGIELVKKGKKKCSTLYTGHGLPLTASHKHKVFTDSGWKYVEDVKTGDYMLTSSHKMNLKKNKKYSEEDYLLLGVWLARGVSGCKEFTIRKKSKKNLSLLPETDTTAWFPSKHHKHHYELRCIHKCEPESCIHNPPVALLKRAGLGIRPASKKVIPRRLMRCSDAQLAAFLKGLLLAGLMSKGKAKVMHFKHLSEKLRKQVFLLLKRADIACSWDREHCLRFSPKELNKIVWTSQLRTRSTRRVPKTIMPLETLVSAWASKEDTEDIKHHKWLVNERLTRDLTRDRSYSQDWLDQTMSHIGECELFEPDMYRKLSSFFWTIVKGKEDAGERVVYDIEVSTGEFVANGLLVHNTKQLSAMVAGVRDRISGEDFKTMSDAEKANLKDLLPYNDYKKLQAGESVDASLEIEKIKRTFETYTPETKEFGYVTGVEVNKAIAKAQSGFGDYTEVFESYLKHTKPIEGKVVVRDIQDVTRAMFDYGRKLGDYNQKSSVASVDVMTRLMFAMDEEDPEVAMKALMDPEKHRALEDALTHETPMLRRQIEMTAAMREVHLGTEAGDLLKEQASRGEGLYHDARQLLQMTETIVPDIERIRVKQRFQRGYQDIEEKGRIPTRSHSKRVYKRGVIDSAGNAAEMNMVEHAYVNLRSTDALAEHLKKTAAYPTLSDAEIDEIHQEMRPKTPNINHESAASYQSSEGALFDAEQEMNDMFERRKEELVNRDPVIASRQLDGEAQKMGYNLDLSAKQMKKAGIKLAIGMGGIAAVGAAVSVGTSVFGKNKDTIDSFSYYDYLESQARFSGMYSQGIMAQNTYSDFGSPYRGPVSSTATLTNQTLGREEQQFRQDRHIRSNTEAIEALQNRTPMGMLLQMTPFELEKYFNADQNVRIINSPMMDMQMNLSDMRRNSKDAAKFLGRHSLQFGNFTVPTGTGPLSVMSQDWQAYSGQLMHDTTQFTRKHAYGSFGALESSKFAQLNQQLAKTYSSFQEHKFTEEAMRGSLSKRKARLNNYSQEMKDDMARMQQMANKYIGIKR